MSGAVIQVEVFPWLVIDVPRDEWDALTPAERDDAVVHARRFVAQHLRDKADAQRTEVVRP